MAAADAVVAVIINVADTRNVVGRAVCFAVCGYCFDSMLQSCSILALAALVLCTWLLAVLCYIQIFAIRY